MRFQRCVISIVLLFLLMGGLIGAAPKDQTQNKPLISVQFASETVRKAVPRIDYFYQSMQDKYLTAPPKKGEFPKLIADLRKELGAEAVMDPYIQYLIAVIECNYGVDRAAQLKKIAESNRGFWEAWQATVVADLVYNDVKRALITLRLFQKTVITYCEELMRGDFDEERVSCLERSAESLNWIIDTAKIIGEFDTGKNSVAEEVLNNAKAKDVVQRTLDYGSTKEFAGETKEKLDAAAQQKRQQRFAAKTAEARALLTKWSTRISEGWDTNRKQFSDAFDAYRIEEREYRGYANNLSKVANNLNQAQRRLQNAQSSNNGTAAKNAADEIDLIQSYYRVAENEEAKAASKLQIANRKMEAALNTLVNRANGALNFDRMFAVKYRDCLVADDELANSHRDFQQRLRTLDYKSYASSASSSATDSERKKQKAKQLEIAMRIQIGVEDILETARQHAASP